MTACSFAELAAGMAVLAMAVPDERPAQCTHASMFYVTVAQNVTVGYEVEHVAKVCTEHEYVLSGVEGYLTSRKIRIPA